eukprot:TRINITY_DN21711_c0_g1_i1.p1 TRINITY_DN21711_c0_g1~~TRINITY_DN21711_c0_g1_i1.p1  ORF type:complete len:263 (-),score=81.95 TRINITY_DN21711_c0_g1_i1:610-1398(-)
MAQSALVAQTSVAAAAPSVNAAERLSFRSAVSSAAPFRTARLGNASLLRKMSIESKQAGTRGVKATVKKSIVEDGVFGTSGGFGFTKQNELFVGRLAMLGFAASLIGEALTGDGICAQLGLETNIPLTESEPLVVFFIIFNVLGAIGALGDRGKFVDEPKTGVEKAIVTPGKGFKAAIGLSDKGPTFGFTKANELFVGRLAQLGFVASIIGEIITGKGALAQLQFETGVPIQDVDFVIIFFAALLATTALTPGAGKFVEDDE